MPEMDTSQRPDLTDLADDDIRAVSDEQVRNALYRMAERIRAILLYQDEMISALYDAVTTIEEELP